MALIVGDGATVGAGEVHEANKRKKASETRLSRNNEHFIDVNLSPYTQKLPAVDDHLLSIVRPSGKRLFQMNFFFS